MGRSQTGASRRVTNTEPDAPFCLLRSSVDDRVGAALSNDNAAKSDHSESRLDRRPFPFQSDCASTSCRRAVGSSLCRARFLHHIAAKYGWFRSPWQRLSASRSSCPWRPALIQIRRRSFDTARADSSSNRRGIPPRNAKQFRIESSVTGQRWLNGVAGRLCFSRQVRIPYSEGFTMTNNDNHAVRL
jgi:hypothetical protein